jgi:hypothetical protein
MDTNLVLFWGMVLFVVVGAALLGFRKEMRGGFTAKAGDKVDKAEAAGSSDLEDTAEKGLSATSTTLGATLPVASSSSQG